MNRPPTIGIGGPVGSGKTALLEALVPRLIDRGFHPLVITNDIHTQEDALHARRALAGVLPAERILGVETGTCPHAAVREDPSMNLAALEELAERFPDGDVALVESGGDNLTLTFGPALADFQLYVIDLAPYVGVSLDVMARDARLVRGEASFVFTNCRTGDGVDEVLGHMLAFLAKRRSGAPALG